VFTSNVYITIHKYVYMYGILSNICIMCIKETGCMFSMKSVEIEGKHVSTSNMYTYIYIHMSIYMYMYIYIYTCVCIYMIYYQIYMSFV